MRAAALALAALALSAAAPAAAERDPRDPWEPMNRVTHAFNEGLDRYLVHPVAIGWDFVAPDLLQQGVDNVFDNLFMPVVFLNDLLQAKPRAAAIDFARFVLNSTAGVGGLFDLASHVELPENDEDFGQTLGVWGVPTGPYLVLPIFGPSSPRGTTGLLADAAAYPWGWLVPLYVTIPARAFDIVNLRAIYAEEIADNRESSFDYYVFLREAYLDNRAKKVADRAETDDDTEQDLYFFEDE